MAVRPLPDDTVIDGEVVAHDQDGRPSFNLLQNFGSARAQLIYYVFDLLVLSARGVKREPLDTRRDFLRKTAASKRTDPVFPGIASESAGYYRGREQSGPRRFACQGWSSHYEPGKRSGAWQKTRVNRRQDFVIGGYTTDGHPFALAGFKGQELV